MNNILSNWWNSQQFKLALKQGNRNQAIYILRKIQKSGVKLSLLEETFYGKLSLQKKLNIEHQQVKKLKQDYTYAQSQIQKLNSLLEVFPPSKTDTKLQPQENFIQFVEQCFKLKEYDKYKLQCTGIDESVFNEFEASLVASLQEDFYRIDSQLLKQGLKEAQEDIECLKRGQDPVYSFNFTPYVYFMRYFLDNVYCAYLAWFLIYKSALLPKYLNILDIAAGPSTIAYGLALFLKSSQNFLLTENFHTSYYSLEQLDLFQFRGLQFWRKYIEPQPNALNAYFRFDTTNIFDYDETAKKIPHRFFDFIVISHCTFNDPKKREESHKIYRKIIKNSLKEDGYILLIVQDKKIYMPFNKEFCEDIQQEKELIQAFLNEMNLKLIWYKYLTSTGKRSRMKSAEFAQFAELNLFPRKYMKDLVKHYLGIKQGYYTLDDYVILAQS